MTLSSFVLEPKEDERKECFWCGKEIRWCSMSSKWYHIAGFTSFCVGMARDLGGKNSTEATPKG